MIDLCLFIALALPSGSVIWPAPPGRTQTLLEAAIRRRLGPNAVIHVELLDQSRRAATGDAIEFPDSGISKVGAQEYVWRGRVVMREERRTLPVWARVRIAVAGPVWVAARDIAPGTELAALDARQEMQPLSLIGPLPLPAPQNPAGRVARMRLPEGAVIAATALGAAPAARRGEKVTVRVDRGLARLEFEAEVTATAIAGQSVQLKNPWNGRRFVGRLDSPGRVTVPTAQFEER